MDVKECISKMIERVAADDALRTQFQTDPIQAVERALDIDLPKEAIEAIVQGVKARISADKLSSAADSLKKLF